MSLNGGQPVSDKGAIAYLNQQVKKKNKVLSDLKHDFLLVGEHLGVDKATATTQDYLDAIAELKDDLAKEVCSSIQKSKELEKLKEQMETWEEDKHQYQFYRDFVYDCEMADSFKNEYLPSLPNGEFWDEGIDGVSYSG